MNLRRVGLAALAALAFSAVPCLAAGKEPLKEGDKAPTFQAKDDKGETWKSSDHVGKKILVVYFYPADLTGGCTKQACGFRDDSKKLAEKGVEVVGVSGDSVENHQKFKDAHKLNFTLLADENGAVAKKFGVTLKPGGVANVTTPQGEKLSLKQGVRASRWTFVIGKDGKIIHAGEVKNPAGDSKEILKLVEKEGQ